MSLLVVTLVAAMAYFWLRGARQSRLRWLARLDLPGTWNWQDHDGTLELAGELNYGTFRKLEARTELRGEWRLIGHELRLMPAGAEPVDYDLRFFDAGKIGLRAKNVGNDEARVYVKTPNNVVPLRRGSGV